MAAFVPPRQLPSTPQGPTAIYRLRRPVVSEGRVQELANLLEVGDPNDGQWSSDAFRVALRVGTAEVTMYRASGGWRYRDLVRWQADDGSSNLEISDEGAAAAAMRVLKRFGLDAIGATELRGVSRLHVGVAEPVSGYAEERIIDARVEFGRRLDGLAVDGSGGIAVYLGIDGSVSGIDYLQREIAGFERAVERLKAPDEVLKEIRGQNFGGPSSRVEVDELRLAYFEHDRDVAQRYLEPTWLVSLRTHSTGRGYVSGRLALVPAATNRIAHEPRRLSHAWGGIDTTGRPR